MENDGIEALVMALLDELDAMPAVRERLPFTVAYLVGRLRATIFAARSPGLTRRTGQLVN